MGQLPHLLATASLSLLTVALFLSPPTTTAQPPPPSFKCTTKSRCQALVGYPVLNSTTLAAIQTLFQVSDLHSLLGANNLPLSTPQNHVVSGNRTVRIPFPCRCINGIGRSDRVPVYTVASQDFLYMIANQKFGGLVADQQIQAVNSIPNPDLIHPGDKLWIPLPCSCDDVDGQPVIHYAHVVAGGSSVGKIAVQFGTSAQTLMSVNGITDPKKLSGGQVLDVPLQVCSSSINRTSPDPALLVATNTYAVTANDCVQCKCDPSRSNFTLNCQKSGLKPASATWATCPPAQCSTELSLGDSTNSSGCSRSTCTYAGYNSHTILTNLTQDNTCPATPPQGSGASKMNEKGWSLALAMSSLCMLILQHRLFI